MKYINICKTIFCIIILFVVVYWFYYSRVPGCMDTKAINYNKDANSYKKDSCIYETLGCSDPKAVNYNKWANTSCIEDCNGSNNSKCEFTKGCSSTPEHLCKYNIKGCARPWSSNKDDKAIIDDNSCLTMDDFMSRIVIMSGGACNGCSNKVFIKIDNDYIVDGGYDGINMVIIDRNLDPITNKIIVRNVKHFNTGVMKIASEEFVDYCKNYLSQSDIVIIAIKGDAIGQYAQTLNRVISQDALTILKKLGATQYEFMPNGSYILIGTLLLDIYFESSNNNRDAYYPLFNLVNIGCINIYDKSFRKIKLDVSKNKMIVTNNPNMDEFVWRCALEVHSLGYDVYMIKGKECYIVTDPEIENNEPINIYKKIEEPIFYKPKTQKFNNASNVRQFIKNNWMASDTNNIAMATNVGNNLCEINQFFQTIGSNNQENYYIINEAFHSKYYVNDIGSLYTYIYSADNFTGAETLLETGVQTPLKVFSQRKSALLNGGFEIMPVSGMKVPAHHFVISFKTINIDKTLNNINIPEYYMFSGPSTADLKKNIKYTEYPLIVKNQKYVSSISSFLIINGNDGILLFEQPKYSGLVIRLAYGRYVLPDLYIKPYLSKVFNMFTTILNDLQIKFPTFIDKSQNPKDVNSTCTMIVNNNPIYDINIIITIVKGVFDLLNYKNYTVLDDNITFVLYDTNNKPTFMANIFNYLFSGLTFTSNQYQSLLSGIFKLMKFNDHDKMATKYVSLIDGMPIGSLKSYIKGNTCVRFFSDDKFNNLIYTWYVRRIAISPYAEVDKLPYLDDMSYEKPYSPNNLCKSVIVDKLGFIKIYNDLNPYLFYTKINYDQLINENNNRNFISVNTFKEFVNQDSNGNTINPIMGTNNFPYNWNPNAGIIIDEEVAIIRLMSVLKTDNISSYFFINQYKSLYEQFRKSIFSLFNFTNDDIPKLYSFLFYKDDIFKNYNDIIIETDKESEIDFPIIKGAKVRLGSYKDKNVFTFENALLVNGNYDSYFYSGANKIIYIGTGTNIYIAQLPIIDEKFIEDYLNTSLNGYNLNIKYAIIQLIDKNNDKFYHVQNGYTSQESPSGYNNFDFKKISLIGYTKIIIYNLDFDVSTSVRLQHFSSLVIDRNTKLDVITSLIGQHQKIDNIVLINIIKNIYGALLVYNEKNILLKHIPIFKNKYWDSYKWTDITNIINYLPTDIGLSNLSYYNLLDNNISQWTVPSNDVEVKVETEIKNIYPINYVESSDRPFQGVYICEIEGTNYKNINQILLLKNMLTNLKVPCFLQVIYQPFEDDDETSVLEQYDNYQLYIFRNNKNNVIFTSGTRMISVVGGNWNITFKHDLYSDNIYTSNLYIPSSDNNNVNNYDRSVFMGNIIQNFKDINNVSTLINTVSSDVFLEDVSGLYDHLLNVKKYWPSLNKTISENMRSLEPVFVEYLYKTSRWIIKMPYNLPVMNISWKRHYGEDQQ